MTNSRPIVAIDIETGGKDPRSCALLSASFARLGPSFDVEESLDVYFLPSEPKRIDDDTSDQNGYSPGLWKKNGAMTLKDGMAKIQAWIPFGSKPLAHGASFPRAFLIEAMHESGIQIPLSKTWRCTKVGFLMINDAFDLGYHNMSLDTLSGASGHWLNGRPSPIHSSSVDVLAIAAGYSWLIRKMRQGRPVE